MITTYKPDDISLTTVKLYLQKVRYGKRQRITMRSRVVRSVLIFLTPEFQAMFCMLVLFSLSPFCLAITLLHRLPPEYYCQSARYVYYLSNCLCFSPSPTPCRGDFQSFTILSFTSDGEICDLVVQMLFICLSGQSEAEQSRNYSR